jgi:UDPglucose 6-dehydrogenase
MREAPSEVLINALLAAGAAVRAHDPVAMSVARREWPADWFRPDGVTLIENQYEALKGADALVLVTEWKPFRHPDFDQMKAMLKTAIVFDGRNQYDPALLRRSGWEYVGIGR